MKERFRAIHTVVIDDDCVTGKKEQYNRERFSKRKYLFGIRYYHKTFNLDVDERANSTMGFNSTDR